MKRTCNGCRALMIESNPLRYSCELGYNIDKIKAIPLELCPKPKTIDKFIIERNKNFFK